MSKFIYDIDATDLRIIILKTKLIYGDNKLYKLPKGFTAHVSKDFNKLWCRKNYFLDDRLIEIGVSDLIGVKPKFNLCKTCLYRFYLDNEKRRQGSIDAAK